MLVLSRDRAFETHQRIHPWRILCLDLKLRVRTVLAPAVGDPIVDDYDLTVVAQVNAT